MNFDSLEKYAPIALALLRIVAALLFIEHGTQKFFDFPASGRPGPAGGLPPQLMLAGCIEVVGGLLVLVGFGTRFAALVMSGEMAVAYWMAHVPRGGFFPLQNFGESAVLFCFVFLYLVFAGPGAWSLDGRRLRREQPSPA
ncbi:MAG: DoxX family protein [Devosia sp.]